MKKINFSALIFVVSAVLVSPAGADDHSSGKQHEHEAAEGAHEDLEKDEHGHEEKEEVSENVGPTKGVVEAHPEQGIKLSPEALKNFEIKVSAITGSGPWTIPSTALLLALEESNLYRLREGFYKRIDFSMVKNNGAQVSIQSKDLRAGDQIVIAGVGFLRIAELTAFGGAPEGHSH